MARSWVELGHRVTIVAASRSHVRTVPPTLRGNYTRESIEGVDYIWLKTPSYEGNGPRRALDLFAFVGQLLGHGARLAREVEPDAVIASSTYPLDMIAARRIARRAKARLVFEVHDLWPLSPIELGGMSPRHPFIRLMQ